MAHLLSHNPKVFILKELIKKKSMYEDDLIAHMGMDKAYFRTLMEPLLDRKFIREFKASGRVAYMIEMDGKWAYEAYASDLLLT